MTNQMARESLKGISNPLAHLASLKDGPKQGNQDVEPSEKDCEDCQLAIKFVNQLENFERSDMFD